MQLYKPIHDRFERFCRARVYGEMEHGDLMNESLLIAFEKFDRLKEKKAFLSFLFGIAIRVLSNSKRKKKPIVSLNAKHNNYESTERTEQLTDVSFLHEALALLPEEQRESLILFEISGFSIKEIAKLHGVGESAVKQRLRRGRIKLSEILKVKSSPVKTSVA